MAELKNELKWSHTRQKNWDACRRRYYLAHYAHWNGWRRDAPDLARRCYILTKMYNLPILAGSIVHDMIERILLDLRAGHTASVDDRIDQARARLNEAWQQSRERAWERDPKRNVNLFEHFHGLPVSREEIDRTRDTVTTCLKNLFATGVWSVIRSQDAHSWRSVEELESFQVGRSGEFGVWVKIDFSFQDGDGVVHLIDWKTGREDPAHHDQLMAYALFAHREWGFSPQSIRIVPVYLRENRSETHSVTAKDMAQAEKRILNSCREMAAACDDPMANTASIENFPMTSNRRECARCFFQSICFEAKDWPCQTLMP